MTTEYDEKKEMISLQPEELALLVEVFQLLQEWDKERKQGEAKEAINN